MKFSIQNYETVSYNEEKNSLRIIDQTLLPNKVEILDLTNAEEIWEAIYKLRVRGAPAIGVAAAIGIYVIASRIKISVFDDWKKEVINNAEYLNSSRPTAVNLKWALDKMIDIIKNYKGNSISEVLSFMLDECKAIHKHDIEVCKSIGIFGKSLLRKNDGVLTHCNAGALATVKYGTATAPMYLSVEDDLQLKIYCDETRPLLQGARLTAFELYNAGLDVTLQCDNMAASLMKSGKINAVFVGCDRVAANGDAANKIGTLGVAILAKYYNIPVYFCAPTSTIDMNTKTGDDIIIEQRDEYEVKEMWYKEAMSAKGVKVYNPAFDVTDNELITAFITEKGIVYPPFREGFENIFKL